MESTPENISRFYKPGWFLPFWNHLKGKTSQWRSVGWLRWLKHILECRIFLLFRFGPDLEIEGKVKDTQVQIITRIKFSIDNFSLNFQRW